MATQNYSYIHFQSGSKSGWAYIEESKIDPNLSRHLRFRISNTSGPNDSHYVEAALTFYHDSWMSEMGALIHLDDPEEPFMEFLEYHNDTFSHRRNEILDTLKVAVAPVIHKGFNLALIAFYDPKTEEASFCTVYVREPNEAYKHDRLSAIGGAMRSLSASFVCYSGGYAKQHFVGHHAELATTIATFAKDKS